MLVNDKNYQTYETFFQKILTDFELYTDPLVIDEILWVCRKKYGVPYNVTIQYVTETILKAVTILDIKDEDVFVAMRFLNEGKLSKPSDALHLAVIIRENITTLVSEDSDFDGIKDINRYWIV